MTALIAPSSDPTNSGLLDVKAVAQLLGCSTRHVFRLAGDGKMPPPLHVGHLVRWRRTDLDSWLAAGCPALPKLEGVQP